MKSIKTARDAFNEWAKEVVTLIEKDIQEQAQAGGDSFSTGARFGLEKALKHIMSSYPEFPEE